MLPQKGKERYKACPVVARVCVSKSTRRDAPDDVILAAERNLNTRFLSGSQLHRRMRATLTKDRTNFVA